MLNRHSYLSDKCIASNVVGQEGVFVKENICIIQNEMIAVWGGIVCTTDECKKLSVKYPRFLTHTISVADGFYLGPINPEDLDKPEDAELFNHSCDPNAGIKGQVLLVAKRNIEAREEICFDYGTSEVVDEKFECGCGSPHCRGTISGDSWKDPDFQKRNEGYFSWYIQQKIDNLLKNPTSKVG